MYSLQDTAHLRMIGRAIVAPVGNFCKGCGAGERLDFAENGFQMVFEELLLNRMSHQLERPLILRDGRINTDYYHPAWVNGNGPEVHHSVMLGAENQHIGLFVDARMRPSQRSYVVRLCVPPALGQRECEPTDLALIVVEGF